MQIYKKGKKTKVKILYWYILKTTTDTNRTTEIGPKILH